MIGLYPHLLPTKLKNSLTFPTDVPKLEGVDFEKALIALIEYLNDVSDYILVLGVICAAGLQKTDFLPVQTDF